jgi:hypothetical protein
MTESELVFVQLQAAVNAGIAREREAKKNAQMSLLAKGIGLIEVVA